MEDIQDTRDREMRGRRESSGDRQGTQSPAEGERVADPTNDDDKDVNDEDQDVL